MKRHHWMLCSCLAFATGTALADTDLTTVRVASGLARPVYVTAPPGDTDRLFVVEQRSGSTGRIRILDLTNDPPTPLFTPFLNVTVSTGSEQGLLGLAFHPDYANNRTFFINYTNSGGTTVVEKIQASAANPDVADVSTRDVILQVGQFAPNHNGGWIGFGPDGYLYVPMGDGGGGGDPGNHGQRNTTLLGTMLRLDVDNDDFPGDPNRDYAIPADNPLVGVAGLDEVWAWGLRNPWRPSFDRATGDLYIADVGQGAVEEISFQPAASTGGENYGWHCYEGNSPFDLSGCGPASTFTFPIQTYPRSGGNCSITGGFVYRGCDIPDLQGTYFYADFCSNRIWSLRYDPIDGVSEFQLRSSELAPGGGLFISSISSFGEDAAGEMYICDIGGEVFKIVADGVLDGDLNCDGNISVGDINPFVLAITDAAAYEAAFPDCDIDAADINGDNMTSVGDINGFVALVTGGPCP